MFRKITGLLSLIIGLSFGLSIGPTVWEHVPISYDFLTNLYFNGIIFTLLFGLIGWIIAPHIERVIRNIQAYVNRQTPSTVLYGTGGTIIGLLIGYFVSLPFTRLPIPFLSSALPLILSVVLAVLGYQTAISRKDEWSVLLTRQLKERQPSQQVLERKEGDNFYKYKLLDTSVIIDGRIVDIAQAGFIEGVMMIPNFVLHELQVIADSVDNIKRAKGRRGLDILNDMQKNKSIHIEFYEGDFDDISEVDSKLMRLAKMLDAAIVTNDYNLSKVCEFQGIKVFNIHALSNAVKPVVVPGEELKVLVVKEGTERKQGVAYLEDGTMIVVEDGQYYMNDWLTVVVTSALQTSAGRMIFAKPIHSQKKIENKGEISHDKN